MHIHIDTTEVRDGTGAVVIVTAKAQIEIELDGKYSVPKLEAVQKHLDAYLNKELPKCLLANTKRGAK